MKIRKKSAELRKVYLIENKVKLREMKTKLKSANFVGTLLKQHHGYPPFSLNYNSISEVRLNDKCFIFHRENHFALLF